MIAAARSGFFAAALRRMPGREPRGGALHARFAAILLYMGIGLSPQVPFFTPSDARVADSSVVDGTGHVWLMHHIRGASVLLGLCAMGLVSLIALRNLRRLSR